MAQQDLSTTTFCSCFTCPWHRPVPSCALVLGKGRISHYWRFTGTLRAFLSVCFVKVVSWKLQLKICMFRAVARVQPAVNRRLVCRAANPEAKTEVVFEPFTEVRTWLFSSTLWIWGSLIESSGYGSCPDGPTPKPYRWAFFPRCNGIRACRRQDVKVRYALEFLIHLQEGGGSFHVKLSMGSLLQCTAL
jgi:hypothetical protein